MSNKNKLHKEIIEAIKDAGYEPESYSGRGMYGKRCVGVTCENPVSTCIEIVQALAMSSFNDADEFETVKFDEFCHLLSDVKTDSMGMSTIVYWPNIPAPEDDEI